MESDDAQNSAVHEASEFNAQYGQSENYSTCNVCTLVFPSLSSLEEHQKNAHDQVQNNDKISPLIIKVKLEDQSSERLNVTNGEAEVISVKKKRGRKPGRKKKVSVEPSLSLADNTFVEVNEAAVSDLIQDVVDSSSIKGKRSRRPSRKKLESDINSDDDYIPKKSVPKSSKFSCDTCDRVFRSQQGLIDHSRVHTGEKPFKCDDCDESFRHRASLRYHQKKVHEDNDSFTEKKENYTCGECDRVFYSAHAMKLHIFTHDIDSQTCPICDQDFDSHDDVLGHLDTHIEAEDLEIRQEETTITLSQKKGEQNSFEYRKLTGVKKFGCVECLKAYTSIQALKYHSKCHAEGERRERFQCDICKKSYTTKAGLKYHTRSPCSSVKQEGTAGGTQVDIFNCSLCSKEYKSHLGVKYHERVVHGIGKTEEKKEETFPCENCDKVYRSKQGLKLHIKVEHTEGYTPPPRRTKKHSESIPSTCEMCGLTFCDAAILDLHQRREHFGMDISDVYNDVRIVAGERPYGCMQCDKEYKHLEALSIHGNKHSGIKPFVCELCGAGFLYRNGLKYHLSAAHDIGDIKDKKYSKLFECTVCDRVFRTQSHYKLHQVMHTGVRAFKCRLCGMTFARKQGLANHMARHDPEKSVELKELSKERYMKQKERNKDRLRCPLCSKHLATKYSLTNHLMMHSGEKPYTCETCGKTFRNVGFFRVHSRIHTGEKPHSCDVCGKKFRFSSSVKMHQAVHVKPDEKSFPCDKCSKVFANRPRYLKHMKWHNTDRPYKCKYCPQTYAKEELLQSHLNRHGGVHPIECPHCSKGCHSQISLERHIRAHHTKQKVKQPSPPAKDWRKRVKPRQQTRLMIPVTCELCPRSFSFKEVYDTHMKLHETNGGVSCPICHKYFRKNDCDRHKVLHSNNVYVCNVCGKETKHKVSYENHMRTHSGEKPYKCRVCTEYFMTATMRGKHMKSRHPDYRYQPGEDPNDGGEGRETVIAMNSEVHPPVQTLGVPQAEQQGEMWVPDVGEIQGIYQEPNTVSYQQIPAQGQVIPVLAKTMVEGIQFGRLQHLT